MDPDNLNIATVILPGAPDPIEVTIQTTVFADMTLGEVLQLVAEYRREDLNVTEIYYDRLMEARTRRYSDISAIGVEHDLPRSYSTIEECKALAKVAFAGARIIRTKPLAGTTTPNDVTKLDLGEGVFSLGGGRTLFDGVASEVFATGGSDTAEIGLSDIPDHETPQQSAVGDTPISKNPKPRATKGNSMKFARPINLKELK